MLVTIHSVQTHFAGALHVPIEINISRGIKFHLIGMPPKKANECRNRVYTVLKSLRWHWPGQRITINIKPEIVPHSSMDWDVPIAIGILASSGQISNRALDQYLFVGTMGLDGAIAPVEDPFNAIELARALGKKAIFLNCDKAWVPHLNLSNAIKIIRVSTFEALVAMLQGERALVALKKRKHPTVENGIHPSGCFSEVAGQMPLKKALEVAVAGGHHLWVEGAPGQGKSILLKRLPSILPPTNTTNEALVKKMQYSMISNTAELNFERPFQWVAPQDGGSEVFGPNREFSRLLQESFTKAEEISKLPLHLLPKKRSKIPKVVKALGGVCVVDELLKQKENVRVGLLKELDHYHFQVFAALNPCPCGHFGTSTNCRCSAILLENHRSKMTGALNDRFDIKVHNASLGDIDPLPEQSMTIRSRIELAWQRQMNRQGKQNAQLQDEEILRTGCFSIPVLVKINRESRLRGYSYRGRKQLMSICLTLMDLEGQNEVLESTVEQALLLRWQQRSEPLKLKKTQWVPPKVKV